MRALNTFETTADIHQTLLREGRYVSISGQQPGITTVPGTITANTLINVGSYTVPAGRCLLINSITVSANKECRILIGISQKGPGGATVMGSDLGTFKNFSGEIGPNGGSLQFNAGSPIILRELAVINVFYARNDTAQPSVSYGIDAHEITNDLFLNSKNKICLLGDSITWTNANDAYGVDLFGFKIVNQLRKDGKSVRLINKGFGGAEASEVSALVKTGYIDVDYDLLILHIGMNDSNQQTTTLLRFKEVIREVISHRDTNRPKASVLICGAPSTDDPNRTPYIANYRTAASEVVAEYGAIKKVYYVDNSTAYANTATDHFNESATPRVHPNKLGHQKIFDVMYTVVKTTDFYQKAV